MANVGTHHHELILIADDDLAARQLLRRMLESDGYLVEEAEDSRVALQKFNQRQPDAVLLDALMPGGGGIELCAQLQKLTRGRQVPVVIITALDDQESIDQAFEAGAEDYITKPIRWPVLRWRLRRLLTAERAERELEDKHNLLRTVIDNIPDHIYVKDAQARTLISNAAHARLMDTVRPPEVTAGYQADDLRVLEAGQPQFNREELTEDSGGAQRWMLTTRVPLRDRDENIIGLMGISRDITELKVDEQVIQRSEERFRSLVQHSSDLITVQDADSAITYQSPSVERILGYPAETWLGKTLLELVHPDDVARVSITLDDIARNPEALLSLTARFRRADGSWRMLEGMGRNLLDQPAVAGIVTNFHDVTERTQAEEKLRQSELNLAMAQRVARIGSWELDLTIVEDVNRNALRWSDELFRIFGYQPGETEVSNDNFFRAVHPDDREKIRAAVAEAIATGNEYNIDHRIILPDGSERIIHEQSVVVRDLETGQPVKMVGTAQDVTESRRSEEALAQERNLLRTLIDHLPDYIFTKDLAERFVISNIAHARAARVASPEDLVGKRAAEVFPPEIAAQYHADDLAVLESGQPMINLERVSIDDKGNRRAMLTSKVPLRDGSGAVVGLVGISRDISDRRRAESAIQQRNAELATLTEVGQALNQLAEPVAMLELIFTTIGRVIDTKNLYIALYDDVVNRVDFPIYNMEGVRREGVSRAFGNGLTEHVLRTKAPLLINEDLQATLADLGIAPYGTQSRSYLGVPMIAGDRAIGVIAIQDYAQEHAYEENHVSVLKTVAAQAASALTNARLFARAQQEIAERRQAEEALRKSEAAEREQRELAETLRDTALALAGKLDTERVMNNILVNIDRVVRHDGADIMLIDGDVARIVAWHGYPAGPDAGLKDLKLSLDAPNLREMLRTHAPMMIGDTQADPGWAKIPGSAWIRSVVGAPIQVRGEVIGFLSLSSTRPGYFTVADAEHLHLFAIQAGIAIDNARLVEELRRYTGELERRVDERTLELQHAKDDIEAVLNNSSDAILVVHANGTIRQVNPTFGDLFGSPPDSVLGQSLCSLVEPDYMERLSASLNAVIAGGGARRIEVEACRQGGSVFSADVGLSPIVRRGQTLGSDKAPEVVCSIRDITERKRIERELQELSRMKTEFLSTAAHELRTPLTSILGFSELLVTRELEGDRGKRYLRMIHEQSVQLHKIIDALLDISRLEAKQSLALDLKPIDVGDLISKALAPFTESSPKHRFQVDGLSTHPAIVGDSFRVNQVLQNLLSNAVKYSPQGGTVVVRWRAIPDFVEVTVQDSGIGMTPQQQSHLFERFYRADSSNTTISGTGLGLAISRLIVELHGGSIWVESEYKVGTVVHFTLPLAVKGGSSKGT